jgi:predicted transcriptional regulator
VLKSKDNSLQELARKTIIYIDRRILGHRYDNLFLKKIFIYDQYIDKERGIIIKQTSVKELDEKDLEFVEALRSLNVPRNVATLITYLANTDEVTSREIEIGSKLGQPEVSIGMRTLRQNNWIEERDIKSKEKGRPVKVYKLSVPIGEIIRHYEDVKNSESAQAMQAIQKLKDITAK